MHALTNQTLLCCTFFRLISKYLGTMHMYSGHLTKWNTGYHWVGFCCTWLCSMWMIKFLSSVQNTTTTRQQQHCDLNQECSEQHFAKISRLIVDWREIAPFLRLTEAEEINIRDSTPHSIPTQKMAMLRKWKEKLGTKATYKCLCQAFEDCEKGNLLVKQLAASSSSSKS